MVVAEIVFWSCLVLVGYVYAGYPLLLAVWSRLGSQPVRRERWEPTVTVVMAVHNERDTIARKIENCRALDYPPSKLQLVVSLDGPTDGTDRIVAACAGPGLCIVGTRRRQGKAAALNRGIAAATGEVIVFCDARQRIEPQALRELVADLRDPSVGAVSGELMLETAEGGEGGVGLYWRYEKALRAMESRIHSTVGATGALYAVRRELVAPIPEAAILDDMIVPLRTVLDGRRTVFEPRARAFDRACPPELEFTRKVRTLAGNFQLLALMPELLRPGRNPVFLQFVSHKLGRLVVPYLLILLFASNLLLREGFYLAFLACQSSWYALAAVGAVLRRSRAPSLKTVEAIEGGAR